MLFWKKQTPSSVDLSWLGTDIHSHLLPGIDDGSPDMATSLELLKGLAGLGYKKVVTTPHVLWEIYPNTSAIITQKCEEVKEAIVQEGLAIEFSAAAEYYIDNHFEATLKKKIPLLPIKDNLVLVEFSMITAPLDLKELLFEMQLTGYQPLIAHPERYIYLQNKKEFFDDLKNNGCFFQLNLLSLTRHYGTSVQSLAEYLVKMDYYDYAGTDMHNQNHLEALQKLHASPLYTRLQQSGTIKNHLL